MANVFKCTIICFALVIHESTSSFYIRRNLCLETVARFINHQDKCSFDLSTASDILQDVTTCPKKCSFLMVDLNQENRYSLRKIDLTLGNEEIIINLCSRGEWKTLFINCSSWNARNLELEDSCELTEQCIQPFSVCLNGKCSCINGYSAFDTDNCHKDAVPVGGFCSLDEQCTGSNNSGICKHGRCTCVNGFTLIDLACERDAVPVGGFCSLDKQCTGSNNSGICEYERCICANGFTLIDLACEKDQPNSLGSSNNQQQHDTNIRVTLGTLFGGFFLGVIVTAVVTILMYKRLKFQIRKREEPSVMFADNRSYDRAGFVDNGAQISKGNDKKKNVLSPYCFSKETQGCNLSRNQENERTEDVYNHLHEETEKDDTYDHACAAPNYSTDISDYSNLRDTATVQPSPSKDEDDYSTLRH